MTTETVTLAQLQRWAETDVRHLSLDGAVEVRWGGERGSDGRGGSACIFRRCIAHAHVGRAPMVICIQRGMGPKSARETIRHEVAHFAPKGNNHSWGHVKAQAALGSKPARRVLVSEGKARCPKHSWRTLERKSEALTARGMVITFAVECRHCGRKVG